ncbi:hypothetical protein EQ500_12320, partial [Lactobacillus sp. XV13L]|nr:hypothetical protein [Lactobacillus sp. XV13L]
MKKVASSNIAGLDLMKLFASLLVVGIHSELILALNTKFHTQVFMIAARMAVPVFFISSSFLLARHIAAHHNQIAAVKHYVRRVSQLYLFWLVLYGYFIIRATIVNIQVNGWHWTNFIYGLLGCL